MITDVEAVIARALTASAIEILPAKDYDYGYWSGEIVAHLRHRWLIETKL